MAPTMQRSWRRRKPRRKPRKRRLRKAWLRLDASSRLNRSGRSVQLTRANLPIPNAEGFEDSRERAGQLFKVGRLIYPGAFAVDLEQQQNVNTDVPY